MTDGGFPSADERRAARPAETALYVSAFLDELRRCGVRDVVISPGSRSTPLAMIAYASSLNVYIDIDERGAAFFALGLAKANGRPVAVIATSGTAVGNYLPAVLEAESSRVPLVVLTADRPGRLQGLGASQTCDQLKLFGDHVALFRQMPEPAADETSIAFARQAARETVIAAAGCFDASFGSQGGSLVDAAPVHVNFPFDDPLKPDLTQLGLFEAGRSAHDDRTLPPRIGAWPSLGPNRARDVVRFLAGKRVVAVCGERTFAGSSQARVIRAWACAFSIPLLADPLSQLRSFDDPLIIDNYDGICADGECPSADVIIRFGRWPVSKALTQVVESVRPVQIVVDPRETRDFTCSTDVFMRMTPAGFVSSLLAARAGESSVEAHACAEDWMTANERHRQRIQAVAPDDDGFEGAYVAALLDAVPSGTLVFSGNSMAIRALDTFLLKADRRLPVLCNRGLNGIDGTLSTAFGAAQAFEQTVVLTGDITLLHDLNALALQGEMLKREREGFRRPGIVVVCLDNKGGAIFDMLPQQSADPYFERLFLTPQQVDFAAVAVGFGVPCERVSSIVGFRKALERFIGEPGISLIDVALPLTGVKERYRRYR